MNRLGQLFDDLDTNRSNNLSFYEFGQLLEQLGIQSLSLFDMEDVFRYLDRTQQEYILKEDFIGQFQDEDQLYQQSQQMNSWNRFGFGKKNQGNEEKLKSRKLAPGAFNPVFFEQESDQQKVYY